MLMKAALLIFGCLSVFVTGCSSVDVPLMPTPVLYQVQDKSPLEEIPESQRWRMRQVYYATTRAREDSSQRVNYNNEISSYVNVGMTAVGFGSSNLSWADLSQASKQYPRNASIPLSLAGIFEVGRYGIDDDGNVTETSSSSRWLATQIDRDLVDSRSGEILIYVHGASVNFYNANVFAAQLDHFMGRDLVSVAFSWPTHQNILSYGLGEDRRRSYESAPALVSVIKQLAGKTSAKRIHIITWSAGGRLVSTALSQLREQTPELSAEELRERYRLGTVYFAASDVPADEFVARLPAINDVAERIVVTASSNDDALKKSQLFIRGSHRIGLLNPGLTQAQKVQVERADRLEYVDVSEGSDTRGFDITGHRYWFDHPWSSTDLILSIRGNLPASERGLESSGEAVVWWMPEDYPDRVKVIEF